MDKHAYEFGVKVAMVDAGLMEKEALNPFVRNALIGGGLGAGGGAAMAAEGEGLKGALLGAGAGAGAGLLGTAGAKGLGKLKGALKASKKKKLISEGDKILAEFGKKRSRPIGNALAHGQNPAKRIGSKTKGSASAAAKKTSKNLAAEGGGYGGGLSNINDPNSYNMAQQLSASVPMGQSSAGVKNIINSLMW